MQQVMRYVMLSAVVVVLAGCAARYPEPIRTEVTDLVEFTAAQRDAEAHQGQTARWGGVIASIENSEQRTRLEVVNFRLNGFGRPQPGDQSAGRFVIYLDHFVDPEIYQRGRMITALGEFSGVEEGQIGDFNYYYPVLQASGVELWREQTQAQPMMPYYDPHSLWYRNHIYGVGPYRYYYHPYYHPWGRTPVRAIQRPARPPAQQPPRRPSPPQGVVNPQQRQQH